LDNLSIPPTLLATAVALLDLIFFASTILPIIIATTITTITIPIISGVNHSSEVDGGSDLVVFTEFGSSFGVVVVVGLVVVVVGFVVVVVGLVIGSVCGVDSGTGS
jgi:predicted PurR-regulated permease PerM